MPSPTDAGGAETDSGPADGPDRIGSRAEGGSARPAALSATVLGFLGVAAGAFGAHALDGRLDPDSAATFDTAVRYQLVHALALLAHAGVFRHDSGWAARWGWRMFLLGTALFSGSLYLLVATGQLWLGAVTPFGGLALLAGWLLTGIAAARL